MGPKKKKAKKGRKGKKPKPDPGWAQVNTLLTSFCLGQNVESADI